MGFLREEIKNELENQLKKVGCPEHIIAAVTDIPEGDQDKHMWAHARMVKEAEQADNKLFCLLSSLMLVSIALEGRARGMTVEDFPEGSKIMLEEIAKHETKH